MDSTTPSSLNSVAPAESPITSVAASDAEGNRLPVSLEAPKRLPRRAKRRTAVERAELYCRRNLAKYLNKLEELAMGVRVARLDKDGEMGVYTIPPDRQALQYLVERGMGKVPQRYEVAAENVGPSQFIPWADPKIIEGEVLSRG